MGAFPSCRRHSKVLPTPARVKTARLKLPGADNWITHKATEYRARFVPLSWQTEENGFLFVESCCYNKHFDPDHVYVPVQHKNHECHIYKLHARSGTAVEHVGQIVKRDGETKLSPFGSALGPDGKLWLCCFSENMLIALQLPDPKRTRDNEAEPLANLGEVLVPAPNDVCLSWDGRFVYAGCGSWLGSVPLAAGKGTVWRVATSLPLGKAVKVVSKAEGTMAGIAESKGQLFCAHLQRMTVYGCNNKRINQNKPAGRRRIWTGYCDVDDDDQKRGKYYLADNLSWWDDDLREVRASWDGVDGW